MSSSDVYFLTEPGGVPTGDGRFVRLEDVEPLKFASGLQFRPVLGDNVLVNHVYFDAGAEAPTHVHAEEQIVIVLEGELEFWIGDDQRRTMRRGDVAVVPGWVSHRALAGADGCLEIDVFQPPRRQLLDALRPAPPAS
jgi:quercetin dioxygenase-like cupin family protein